MPVETTHWNRDTLLTFTQIRVNSEANARRIACVEQCFGAAGQPLAVPGRVLVGEGVLTKMCRRKPKSRQFFLFNDVLVYGNILIHKKKYNKQHIIPLEDIKLDNVEDEGELHNGWNVISPQKSFTVYAATVTEKKEWMAHIRKCVNDLLVKRGITQTSKEDSPVWVPDSEARTCMHCRKSEFSIVNRRHHCRKCGILVCNACSNKRLMMPQQSSKPLRVCLTCYHKLSNSAEGRNSSVAVPDQARLNDSSGEESSDDDDESGSLSNQNQFQTYGGE
ncbi:pleckstrin homology domain-containing family F member 2-like isoform X1 [Haliotis rubra]|uniref:pleckstrin homology domain-containing family F member 2-like isoform X1 n=1 Tax=Haliotis rubra TaxID=36100 RepID=UPI001EE5630E|nr:pleckstrin homology domain-containing family F member 2-like isoform X1 [Haliotis rubra]